MRPPDGTRQGKPGVGLFGKNMHLCNDFYGCINMAINVQAAPFVKQNVTKTKRILFGVFPGIAVRHGKGKK